MTRNYLVETRMAGYEGHTDETQFRKPSVWRLIRTLMIVMAGLAVCGFVAGLFVSNRFFRPTPAPQIASASSIQSPVVSTSVNFRALGMLEEVNGYPVVVRPTLSPLTATLTMTPTFTNTPGVLAVTIQPVVQPTNAPPQPTYTPYPTYTPAPPVIQVQQVPQVQVQQIVVTSPPIQMTVVIPAEPVIITATPMPTNTPTAIEAPIMEASPLPEVTDATDP